MAVCSQSANVLDLDRHGEVATRALTVGSTDVVGLEGDGEGEWDRLGGTVGGGQNKSVRPGRTGFTATAGFEDDCCLENVFDLILNEGDVFEGRFLLRKLYLCGNAVGKEESFMEETDEEDESDNMPGKVVVQVVL